jgi:hypothetical protein
MTKREALRSDILSMIATTQVDDMSVETLEQWGLFLNAIADDIYALSLDQRGECLYSDKVILEKVRDLAAACVQCLEENL